MVQLGSRWAAGAAPHPSVPGSLHEAIAAAERKHPGAGSWTLTWLEGLPRCVLDDAVLVALNGDGAVSVRPLRGAAPELLEDEDDDEDDWLS